MNAIPKITARPIIKPDYDNRSMQYYLSWRKRNHAALLQYWRELCAVECGGLQPDVHDFIAFCQTQHDAEMAKVSS